MKDREEGKTKINTLRVIIGTIIISLFTIKSYFYLSIWGKEKYWIGMTISIALFIFVFQNIANRHYLSTSELLKATSISTIVSILIIKINWFNYTYNTYEEELLVFLFLVILSILGYASTDEFEAPVEKNKKKELFNLFYINTSKVHEIAMLIDNKIMKTVEEEINEKDSKTSASSLGSNQRYIGGSLSRKNESTREKSVYESFDVKTTKSKMLETIYSSINKQESDTKELGSILLFKNIELKQRNTDDTVMILNVMKDGDMKQLSNDDSFELDLSKMMDEMLDDFTIDYTFDKNDESYLIQIPYKSKEYFENSYSHSDLQLGKLSIIGIYRGYIDFTNIDSISSKFLKMLSESYKEEHSNNQSKTSPGLTQSKKTNTEKAPDFKIEHNKLIGLHHLIDLIAIIQEIKIGGEEHRK